jgi:hypothetical protein
MTAAMAHIHTRILVITVREAEIKIIQIHEHAIRHGTDRLEIFQFSFFANGKILVHVVISYCKLCCYKMQKVKPTSPMGKPNL